MRIKNEYQNFFKNERFTHHITLSPSNLNEQTVLEHLRKIQFKLNKTFLKSNFPKYRETDKFSFFIFPEDKDIHLQHFHILLYSPINREREFNTDKCISCRFKIERMCRTCVHCTHRVLDELLRNEIPHVDTQINITEYEDYYDNIYAQKKQKYTFENSDTYLVV